MSHNFVFPSEFKQCSCLPGHEEAYMGRVSEIESSLKKIDDIYGSFEELKRAIRTCCEDILYFE